MGCGVDVNYSFISCTPDVSLFVRIIPVRGRFNSYYHIKYKKTDSAGGRVPVLRVSTYLWPEIFIFRFVFRFCCTKYIRTKRDIASKHAAQGNQLLALSSRYCTCITLGLFLLPPLLLGPPVFTRTTGTRPSVDRRPCIQKDITSRRRSVTGCLSIFSGT